MSVIEFWPGNSADLDLKALVAQAVPVKGVSYDKPCRLLEIYGNLAREQLDLKKSAGFRLPAPHQIKRTFLPRVPGADGPFGPGVYQPPFAWDDCDPQTLAVNFTYSTNALYRILKSLGERGLVPKSQIEPLLDQACLVLAHVYRSDGHVIMRNMNNNINMFIVPKVIERIVGKGVYDADLQELDSTLEALDLSLGMVAEHVSLGPRQQMALALGKGVAFIENSVAEGALSRSDQQTIRDVSYRFVSRPLAIDDRQHLLDRVATANDQGREVEMCAILDDTAESVDDLLWIQALLGEFRHFKVNLLVNRAQVSVNFSAHMLRRVLACPHFRLLAAQVGKRVSVTPMYCPLISFQPGYFAPATRKAIARADFVYVKGLNFFETCQLPEKDTYHAFVVYGPISRLYTGLADFEAVFAFLPTGTTGYQHDRTPARIRTLRLTKVLLHDLALTQGAGPVLAAPGEC